eukprot:1053702-Prymnesium_polylepis.1
MNLTRCGNLPPDYEKSMREIRNLTRCGTLGALPPDYGSGDDVSRHPPTSRVGSRDIGRQTANRGHVGRRQRVGTLIRARSAPCPDRTVSTRD